ncbi:MAG: dTMP kinase [Chloroflexi bacterium]|nr:dTMP kinase [Chloroflexota bacterium]
MRQGSNSHSGFFVVFEGPDGGGKTTQSGRLFAHLEKLNYEVKWTREPGGTALADLIRKVVLHDTTHEISPRVEALLLSAARSQHVEEVIRPALQAGRVVVCDRFKYSTVAYQGGGSGLNVADLDGLNEFATDGLDADLVILLDIDPAEGLSRKLRLVGAGESETNKMELRGIKYQERVRRRFRMMASESPDRWLIIDGTGEADEIGDEISRRVMKELESRSIAPASASTGRLI